MQQREQPVCQFLYGNYEQPSHQLSVCCESRGPGVKPQHRQQICTHQCVLINMLFVVSPPQLSAAVMTCAQQQKRDVRMQDNGRKWAAWTTSAGIYSGPLWIWVGQVAALLSELPVHGCSCTFTYSSNTLAGFILFSVRYFLVRCDRRVATLS